MKTDDILITREQGWVEIPLLTNGTFIQIAQVRYSNVNVRVGANSTSMGVLLKSDDTFRAGESIFVRVNNGREALLTVIRDGE